MTTFIIVAGVEDDCGEEFWDAFPLDRADTAARVHADTVQESCKCEIHTLWRAVSGPRMERIELPDMPDDQRVGITVEGHPVHVVKADEFTTSEPVVHLHGPVSGPRCGAPWPEDRKRWTTAYRSEITCDACLATLSPR